MPLRDDIEKLLQKQADLANSAKPKKGFSPFGNKKTPKVTEDEIVRVIGWIREMKLEEAYNATSDANKENTLLAMLEVRALGGYSSLQEELAAVTNLWLAIGQKENLDNLLKKFSPAYKNLSSTNQAHIAAGIIENVNKSSKVSAMGTKAVAEGAAALPVMANLRAELTENSSDSVSESTRKRSREGTIEDLIKKGNVSQLLAQNLVADYPLITVMATAQEKAAFQTEVKNCQGNEDAVRQVCEAKSLELSKDYQQLIKAGFLSDTYKKTYGPKGEEKNDLSIVTQRLKKIEEELRDKVKADKKAHTLELRSQTPEPQYDPRTTGADLDQEVAQFSAAQKDSRRTIPSMDTRPDSGFSSGRSDSPASEELLDIQDGELATAAIEGRLPHQVKAREEKEQFLQKMQGLPNFATVIRVKAQEIKSEKVAKEYTNAAQIYADYFNQLHKPNGLWMQVINRNGDLGLDVKIVDQGLLDTFMAKIMANKDTRYINDENRVSKRLVVEEAIITAKEAREGRTDAEKKSEARRNNDRIAQGLDPKYEFTEVMSKATQSLLDQINEFEYTLKKEPLKPFEPVFSTILLKDKDRAEEYTKVLEGYSDAYNQYYGQYGLEVRVEETRETAILHFGTVNSALHAQSEAEVNKMQGEQNDIVSTRMARVERETKKGGEVNKATLPNDIIKATNALLRKVNERDGSPYATLSKVRATQVNPTIGQGLTS